MAKEVFEESGKVVLPYREPQSNGIVKRFADFVNNKISEPKTLRDWAKEAELLHALDTAIANSGREPKAVFETAWENVGQYIISLYEWGDKYGARAFIDFVLERSQIDLTSLHQ